MTAASNPIGRALSSSCALPSPNTVRRRTQSREGCSSSPMTKSKQHYTELGEMQRVLDIAHERKTPRPDEHAGDEIAEDGAEAKSLEEWYDEHRWG